MKKRKRLIITVLCLSVISVLGGIVLYPRPCGSLLRSEGGLTFYFVTPVFSDKSSLPDFIPEQWTLDTNSDEYQEILDIMDQHLCHIAMGGLSKNNHAMWVTVYNSDGVPIIEYMGTNKIRILGTTYSFYGAEVSGNNMMDTIHSILSDPQ